MLASLKGETKIQASPAGLRGGLYPRVRRRRYLGPMPTRLRPTNPNAADAILVGDPGRALLLAQEVLVDPLMSNHARGLWGYTSKTAAGRPLTVQATGMGGPSAAIVLSDLARLGLKRAIRLGSCESLDPGLVSGEIVLVEAATAEDTISRGLRGDDEAGGLVMPNQALTARLAGEGLASVAVRSGDTGASVRWGIGAPLPEPLPGQSTVFDLQTAALFSLAPRLGIEIAALLVVEGQAAEAYAPQDERLGPESLEDAFRRAGKLAGAALG